MKVNSKAKNPKEYINSLAEPRKTEIYILHKLITSTAPELKSHIRSGMLGYGQYYYRYASGRQGTWFVVGLASQKNYISVYICITDKKKYLAEKYKKDLPKASIGKSCIRFKKLSDIDLKVLKKLVDQASKISKKNNYRFISH